MYTVNLKKIERKQRIYKAYAEQKALQQKQQNAKTEAEKDKNHMINELSSNGGNNILQAAAMSLALGGKHRRPRGRG